MTDPNQPPRAAIAPPLIGQNRAIGAGRLAAPPILGRPGVGAPPLVGAGRPGIGAAAAPPPPAPSPPPAERPPSPDAAPFAPPTTASQPQVTAAAPPPPAVERREVAKPVTNTSLRRSTDGVQVTFVARDGPVPTYTSIPPAKMASSSVNLPQFAIKQAPGPSPSASRITVNTGGRNCIANAIASAPEGSTIVIPAGKYTECLNITKSLYFVAEGRVSIFSDGTAEALIVNAPSVSFEGISIKQKKNHSRAAMAIWGGCTYITNCKIRSIAVSSLVIKGDSVVKMSRTRVNGHICPAMNVLGNGQVTAEGCVFAHSRTIGVTLKGNAMGMFTQCTFEELMKGGVSAIDQSSVYVDSCKMDQCNIDVANDSKNNVVRGCNVEKAGGSGIVCAVSAHCYVYDNSITGCCVDSRDNSSIDMSCNKFTNGSLLSWGCSHCKSYKDNFTGETPAAIGVSQNASLDIKNVRISDVQGCGIVAYGECTVQVQLASISNCRASGIMTHSDARVTIADSDISSCTDFGVIASDTKETTLSKCNIKNCGKCGAEITRVRVCNFNDVKILNSKKCGAVISDTNVSIDRCEFTGSTYSGIHISKSISTLSDCKFERNGKGGLFVCSSSRVTTTNMSFSHCDWTAIFIDSESSFEVAKGAFQENQLGIVAAGECKVAECTFTGNKTNSLQVTGRCDIDGCTFKEEKVAVVATDQGQVRINNCNFDNNEVHLEASQRSTANCVACEFTMSSGDCGVHIVDSTGTFRSCSFTRNRQIAIIAEGSLSISDSSVTESGNTGIVFNNRASGSVRNTKFENNGSCSLLCVSGNPEISGNKIIGGVASKFGIYMCSNSTPTIEKNEFTRNSFANIWRE